MYSNEMALDQKIKTEEDSTGQSCKPDRNCDLLEKNGVIQVIVDDLSEGTIVVSYSLNDNLYQGVLLQLNRERGIPCGISFPKDFCSPQSGITAEEQLEVPPINQRQTYFQNKDVTGSVSPVKTGHGLRKIVKPPARFVNARSLRMRHRPTLCLKCKALCESQESKSGGESNAKSTTVVKAPPVSRKNNAKTAVNPVLKNQLSSSLKEDFSFVSVGSKDFIENYWKRPSLTAPILEDCSKLVEPRTDDQIYATPPKLNVVKMNTVVSHEHISSHTSIGNGNEAHRPAPAHKKSTVQKSEDNIICNTILKQVGSSPKIVVKKTTGRKGLTKPKKVNSKTINTTAASHLNNSDQTSESGSTTLGSEGWIAATTLGPDSSTAELTSESTSPLSKLIPDAAPAKKLKITLPKPPSGSFGRKISLVPAEPKACKVEIETASSLTGRLEDSRPAATTESNGKTIKESFKTPAIKICVGDLTLKIPPKLTEEGVQTAETISERKLRKAFRKLKKDARRKLSMPTEGSPDLSSLDRTNTTELQLAPDIGERTPVSPTINGTSFDATSEHFELAVRKKKKDKKKKKSRPYQDNSIDDENGNSALLCTSGYAGQMSGTAEPLSSTSVSSSPSNGVCSDSVELLRDCSPTLEDSEEKVDCTPKRLCLSLKRYTTDSSTSWDIASNIVPDATDEETSVGSHDFPVNSSSSDICLSTSASVDSYTDSSSSTEYKKGEVVWGKLPGCPWWPAKILDIVACDTEAEEEASAHVSWYKAQTESKVSFSQLVPFMSEYNAKYVRYRKRGNYQNAVQEALEEVGQEEPAVLS